MGKVTLTPTNTYITRIISQKCIKKVTQNCWFGQDPPTVNQIMGSGPTNKDETLMMMGILVLTLMLKVIRGTNHGELRGIGESEDQAIGDQKIKNKKNKKNIFKPK